MSETCLILWWWGEGNLLNQDRKPESTNRRSTNKSTISTYKIYKSLYGKRSKTKQGNRQNTDLERNGNILNRKKKMYVTYKVEK